MSGVQSSSASHLMKTTRRGRPFVKDTHDLFATLIVSLKLRSHRSFFTKYHNSFTTDQACENLASLKFSQSNRSTDPKDPSRIITTTTTTTFSMSREMAAGVGQHLIEAHLIECATNIAAGTFKDRGIFKLTPKGLHILERFITKNGIGADKTLLDVFATQPVCMKLLHLERRTQDDEILVTKNVFEVLFRRFIGREPNVSRLSDEELMSLYYARPPKLPPGEKFNRTEGLIVRKVDEPGPGGKSQYHFSALSAVNWLIDFTTVVGEDEGAEVLGQFVRYGYICLVSDKTRNTEGALIVKVRAGGAGGGAGAIMTEAEFRSTEKAIYRVTEEGQKIAKWLTSGGTTKAAETSTVTRSQAAAVAAVEKAPVERKLPEVDINPKDSHRARLTQILEEPALRSLFREFLRANFCEENLSFWLDVQDFKRRFNTSSSAIAAPGALLTQRGQGLQAMEKHQQDLVSMAFVIYNTYLAPASPAELNIDHHLRGELISYMNEILDDPTSLTEVPLEAGVGNSMQASQLQNMVILYERIQGHIFRLMATDSVPKFVNTDRFKTLVSSLYQYEEPAAAAPEEPKAAAALLEKKGDMSRSYLTVSQAANDKHQQHTQLATGVTGAVH